MLSYIVVHVCVLFSRISMTFKHFDLVVVKPDFDSSLIDVVLELEHLRRLQLRGDTPAPIFFQLKMVFHLLESLGSARIEGNHTTLADYVENKISSESAPSEDIQEIKNLEEAMSYVEECLSESSEITHTFIKELHHLTVKGLKKEGDDTPGAYRQHNVSISGSKHTPPDITHVQPYMDELVNFINAEGPAKYDLLKTAIAHHRFCWIHPYGNGNGRVVRLLTYALLIKYGFNVQTGGRVLNPTAVFCNDREEYYRNLELADQGTDKGIQSWCSYVLSGIRDELYKVDRLTDYAYLKNKILLPAIDLAKNRGLINTEEEIILRFALEKGEFKAGDLSDVMPSLSARQRTYLIGKLTDAGMIQPSRPGARSYIIQFMNNALLRGVMRSLEAEGFTPSQS